MANFCSSYVHKGILKKIWLLYRGGRTGKLVKLKEAFLRYQIKSIQQPRSNTCRTPVNSSISRLSRGHNPANCINITPTNSPKQLTIRKGSERTFVPSILLSNFQSLAAKMKFSKLFAIQVQI